MLIYARLTITLGAEYCYHPHITAKELEEQRC